VTPERRILMDLASRLTVVEAACETQCAQNRELIDKVHSLTDENRQWRRHVERLLRAKEVLLETIGKQTVTRELNAKEWREDDVQRALREMNA
jgi:hypothetical protein